MRTVYYTASTLDGFIATPEHSLDWLLTRQIDPEGPGGYHGFIQRIGALAMGANTYAWLQRHGQEAQDGGDPWPYEMPGWVFTHRDFTGFADKDIRFTDRGVREVHDEMAAAAAGKDIWVVGGGGLAAQFAGLGLLDEVVVSIAPVTIGSGAPLLPASVELSLETVERNGDFAVATYAVVPG